MLKFWWRGIDAMKVNASSEELVASREFGSTFLIALSANVNSIKYERNFSKRFFVYIQSI
jgi:hypothetical protein